MESISDTHSAAAIGTKMESPSPELQVSAAPSKYKEDGSKASVHTESDETVATMTANRYQDGGRQGAKHGLKVEQILAQRLSAKVIGGRGGKADIQEPGGRRHSVKSHRLSQHSRLEAKSYNTCSKMYPELVAYFQARVNGDTVAEQVAAERIAELYNTGNRWEEVIRLLVMGSDPELTRFTVYQNHSEDTEDNLVGTFISYSAETVVQYLANNLHWQAEAGNTHWNINARLTGFDQIAFSISLGSPKRKLVLFTLRNVPKQIQFWEQNEHVPCVEIYKNN